MKLKIKEVRTKQRISLRELSRKSEVAIGYLSELENPLNSKENPSIDVICRIAKALEVRPEELFICN